MGPCRMSLLHFNLFPSALLNMPAHFLYLQVPRLCMCMSYQGLVFPVLQSLPCPPRQRLPLADSGTACFFAALRGHTYVCTSTLLPVNKVTKFQILLGCQKLRIETSMSHPKTEQETKFR